jgi:DNA repair exonuclease SbcCD ATPase subunit
MKIELLSLELKNFKGIKSFELEANGNDLTIYGENEAGKTTLADAWSWLLFDKDSKDQSTQKFDIKPLDKDNQPIHGLETEVKATLQIDNSQLTLKKIFKEVWQKKRGSSEKVFDGHTTDYYISGAPVKKKEYDQKISEIIEEDVFRLLTDPLYFNSQLHWKERRNVLLQLCDGIDNEEVMSVDESLKELTEALKQHDIEKHKAALKEKMNKLNDDIEKIPTRIDEVNNNLPDVSGLDWKEIEVELEGLKEKKSEKEKELARAENGGEIAEKKKRIAEIDGELQEIKNEHTAKYDEKIQGKKQKLSDIKDQLDDIEREIKSKKESIKGNNSVIERLEDNKERLKNKWYELQEEKKKLTKKEIVADTECPTCGQELPECQIEEAIKKANQAKAEKIEEITAEQEEINGKGKKVNEEIGGLRGENKDLEFEIEELENKYVDLVDEADDLQDDINELRKKADKYQYSNEYQVKVSEKKQLQEEIENLRENNKFSLQRIDKEITVLEDDIEIQRDYLQLIKDYNKSQKRIEELKKEERKLAKKYEELEREMALCEQFEKTRAELLESKVNNLFEMAEFKLFEVYQNGSIKPTCRTLYKGVPYNTNLNSGHQTLVGIDIINTLAEHYDFRAPIFADNCESITNEIKTKSQLIQLVARKGVKELRIEGV